ncbi:MAG: 4-hydroxybenzoate octaprenyltransferase [bacterium]
MLSINLLDYLRLMRLDRPVGSLLLLWPTLAALWMAQGAVPPPALIIIFTLGTFLMRSAGCVINDYADRHVDGGVERTRNRPLVTGRIAPRHALMLFAGLCVTAGLLLLFLNRATQLLAVGGLLVAAAYPFMKRWTHLPQVVLGIAFSWGILMAWTATDQGLTNTAGVMFVGSLLWIVAYDTMYAMVDRDDDLQVGIKSTAILFGDLDRVMVGVLQISALLSFLLVGLQLGYQHFYYVGLLVCGALFGYQQYLIRHRDREACFAAFKNNISAGFALFAGTVLELSLHSPGV